jgi:endonuclease YncB( thermonuclease family)
MTFWQERRLYEQLVVVGCLSAISFLTISCCSLNALAEIAMDVNVNAGDAVIVQLNLANPTNESQSYLYIVQVQDESRTTMFLKWHAGLLSGGEETAELGWKQDQSGSYELQTFLWTGFEHPAPLKGLTRDTKVFVNDKGIATCTGDAHCFTGIVTKVIDGDTIRVNEDITIRFALVNSPERGEDGYSEASTFTSETCPVGSRVLVDEDDGQTEGSFGRMIAKVFCSEEKAINEELVRASHAVVLKSFCDESEFAREVWAKEFGCGGGG